MPKEPEVYGKKEVFEIMGAAFEVYNQLGPGFLEAVYHEAMEIELASRRLPFESKKLLRIRFKDQFLKKRYEADFVCFGCVVVEIKATRALTGIDEAQLLNYLKATGYKVGVLINFGSKDKIEWKKRVL